MRQYVFLRHINFTPSFFDISVHLIAHLVKEIRYLDPVYLHHMYPYEKFMSTLNKYTEAKFILREVWVRVTLLRR